VTLRQGQTQSSCPLPDDPLLRAYAVALNTAGQWAEIFDADWRCLYITDDASRMYGGWDELVPYPVGAHFYGPEAVEARMGWRGGQWPLAICRRTLEIFEKAVERRRGSDGLLRALWEAISATSLRAVLALPVP
jgi:hypothetical protein